MVWGKNTPSVAAEEAPEPREEDEETLTKEYADFKSWLDGVSVLPPGELGTSAEPSGAAPLVDTGSSSDNLMVVPGRHGVRPF